jgi:AMP deaminase
MDPTFICHGTYLIENPVLQLLYMTCDIGVSVSVSSNHYLFLDYSKNPIRDFFETGMRISVSTDDGLIFHKSRNALNDEISKVSLMYRFSSIDISELFRNSVLMSTYSTAQKKDMLSEDFADPTLTNLPPSRINFRERIFQRTLAAIYDE